MDVAAWLKGLGLEGLVPAFRDNDIDAEVLPKLTADDLIGLGVTSIGHRRKLLDAIGTFGAEGPATTATAAPRDAPAPAGAERRQLTVMFCDLVGSTALASRLDPEDLREVLGAYHAAVAEVVTGFGGYVAKYMGDGVLAYFGYPQAQEHDAEQAVRAGLALVDRVSRLESDAGALASRIGIATGLVIVGDLIGSGEAQERGVVGETPNLAARLQEMAPANAVLVAENTRRLVGDLFNYRDLGAVTVKGLAEPVPGWQVLSESTIENRFEALRSTSLTPLIGRDEEVGLLLRRWAWAKDGEGQIVLISGEAGIGKSRIAAVLQGRIEPERPIRLRYFCSPHRRDSALFPIIARLERAAEFSRGDAAATKLDKLAALLSRSGDSTPETMAVFADLLGLPTEGRYPPAPTDPRQRRELTLAALVRQLEGLARHRPVLFVFEDAHWIDSTSLELLERVAERVRRLPVLMIVTYRPEFEPPWTGGAQVTSLTLSRLGRRESTTLIDRVAGGKALPAEILKSVVERTDGIPLFIEELTKTVLEGGLLKEEDGRYILAGPLTPLAIPSSLLDSLMARLDRLAPVKEVAQIGAAIGREFSYEVLEAVARRPDDQLRAALDQLVGAGLVFRRGTPPEENFIFKHAFVQDAAYGTLLRGRRQELHAAIAKVLEERAAAAPWETESLAGERAALLAHHWFRAEDWEKALRFTLEAAERAGKLYARPEAISHYWQALDLLERLPADVERNRVHADVILSLIFLPGGMQDETARARMLRHIDRALEDATLDGNLAVAARLQATKGSFWDDEALLVDALARAEVSGDAATQAFAEFRYVQYLGVHGQFEKSLGHVARAIDLLGARGDRLEQARIMSLGGRCYSARAGQLEEALVYASRVQDASYTLDDPRLRALCAMNAEPHLYKGDWDAVVQVAEKALPAAWEIREWGVVLFSSAWLAIAYLKLGKPDDAKRILDRVFKEVPLSAIPPPFMHGVSFAWIALANLHLAVGDTGQAFSAAGRALGIAEQYRFGLEQGAAHRVLGEVHQAVGARAEAEAAFRRSLEVLSEIQSRPELAQTLLAYGRFRRGDNMLENRALIERALRLFEEMNATGWIEEARAALAAA
jgi:class 3 adenylate cyclase/tetratricopeptide (TPR) repeat protein